MTRNTRRTLRLLVSAGLALIVLGPPAYLAYAYFMFDEPPPDDGDLLFVRDGVPLTFTQVLVAIKCYKLAKDDLPAALEDLVPEYMAAVPVDPFDAKPLYYSRAKKIVYSVGKDLMDAGGNTDPGEDFNEPTCRIAF